MSLGKKRLGRLNITRVEARWVIKISRVLESNRPMRLKREVIILEALREKQINTPIVLNYAVTKEGIETIVFERIKGINLCHIGFAAKQTALYSVGQQLHFLKDIFSGFGWLDTTTRQGEFSTWKDFIEYFFQRYGKNLVQLSILSRKGFLFLQKEIQSCLFECPLPYIVHRDLKIGNILYGQDEKIWILDWENALLGDPRLDIAQFGANYGHGKLWKALADGSGFNCATKEYALYEIIILISAIDFCIKYHVPMQKRVERLNSRMAALKQGGSPIKGGPLFIWIH